MPLAKGEGEPHVVVHTKDDMRQAFVIPRLAAQEGGSTQPPSPLRGRCAEPRVTLGASIRRSRAGAFVRHERRPPSASTQAASRSISGRREFGRTRFSVLQLLPSKYSSRAAPPMMRALRMDLLHNGLHERGPCRSSAHRSSSWALLLRFCGRKCRNAARRLSPALAMGPGAHRQLKQSRCGE